MKTTMKCLVCGVTFTRVHAERDTPKFCSHACSNRAPGRMTEEIRLRIGRPNPRNKGGSISRGNKGKPYYEVTIRLADRALHPTATGSRGRMRRSHYVWNTAHPDDPVLPGEIIHHLDEDSLNDVPENLEKMPSQSVHAQHHFSQPRRPLSEAHKLALSIAKTHVVPDRDCEHCGTPLTHVQLTDGGRFCSRTCHYAFRKGKGRTGW